MFQGEIGGFLLVEPDSGSVQTPKCRPISSHENLVVSLMTIPNQALRHPLGGGLLGLGRKREMRGEVDEESASTTSWVTVTWAADSAEVLPGGGSGYSSSLYRGVRL